MGRRRTRDHDLPKRTYFRHGAYYFVASYKNQQTWIHLGADREKAKERAQRLNEATRKERIQAMALARTLSREVHEMIFGERELACVYCGARERLGIDHVVPFSKGGATAPFNLVVSCLSCNTSKGDKDPTEFLASILGLREAVIEATTKALFEKNDVVLDSGNEEST